MMKDQKHILISNYNYVVELNKDMAFQIKEKDEEIEKLKNQIQFLQEELERLEPGRFSDMN